MSLSFGTPFIGWTTLCVKVSLGAAHIVRLLLASNRDERVELATVGGSVLADTTRAVEPIVHARRRSASRGRLWRGPAPGVCGSAKWRIKADEGSGNLGGEFLGLMAKSTGSGSGWLRDADEAAVGNPAQ
jgi:hypothetical protein